MGHFGLFFSQCPYRSTSTANTTTTTNTTGPKRITKNVDEEVQSSSACSRSINVSAAILKTEGRLGPPPSFCWPGGTQKRLAFLCTRRPGCCCCCSRPLSFRPFPYAEAPRSLKDLGHNCRPYGCLWPDSPSLRSVARHQRQRHRPPLAVRTGAVLPAHSKAMRTFTMGYQLGDSNLAPK